MKALAALVSKDLRRRMRSPVQLALTLLFPLALLAIIGITFRPNSGKALPPIPLLVENRDGALLGNFMGSALRNERLGEFFDVTVVANGTGEGIVAKGKAAALLVVPAGFTDDILNGRPTTLTLVKNPGGVILPEIAQSFSEVLALVLSAGTRALRGPLDSVRSMMDSKVNPSDLDIASVAVLVHHEIERARGLLIPPAIQVAQIKEPGAEGDDDASFNIFAYLFPGMAVLGLLFVAQIAMRDIIREREEGHLARLLATPTPMRAVILSKLASTMLLLLACHLLFAACAGIAFGIRPGDIPATLLLVLAEGLAVTGLLALLFAVTKTERQGNALSSVVILGVSLLGGSMLPTDMFPEAIRGISRLTINYWAIDGFREIMLGGGTAGTVRVHVLVLTLFGLATGAAASILLPRTLRRRG